MESNYEKKFRRHSLPISDQGKYFAFNSLDQKRNSLRESLHPFDSAISMISFGVAVPFIRNCNSSSLSSKSQNRIN